MNSWNAATSPSAPARPQTAPTRNVPLIIGLGCFGLVLSVCLFSAALFAFTNVAMRSSAAYKLALSTAQRDPAVAAVLGSPVQAGWYTTGEVSANASSGEAHFEIPLSGPRASGTLAARAHKSGGKWTLSSLSVVVPGRAAPVNLLPATPP